MANSKATKKALFTSMMSLLLCFAMLMGKTFAWFTDSVSSSGNKIIAGDLEVRLLMNADGEGYKDISENPNPIFGEGSIAQNNNAETLWEPGKTQVAYLAIKNEGNLALKYEVNLRVTDGGNALYKVMKYDILPDKQYGSVDEWSGEGDSVDVGNQKVSEVVSLDVGAVHYFALAIHMDEEAGNEYENGVVEFDLTVNATQLNAEEDSFGLDYDKEAPIDDAVFNYGGAYEMTADRYENIHIAEGADVTINGNEYSIIKNDGAGIENYGKATLNDVKIEAGSASDYSNIGRAGSETVYNDVVIDSKGGGIGVTGGGKVIFNSGSLEIDTKSTSGRYLFYAEGEGSEITINGGNFDFNKTQNQKRAYIYAGKGTTVYVNGGTFGTASTRSGYTAGILGDGTVIITGGTFGFDPTAWVPAEYSITKENDVWVVTVK